MKSSLQKVVTEKRDRHLQLFRTDGQLINRLESNTMKKYNKKLYETFKDNKVIVFPSESLEPWDCVTRFDFLDCKLQEVVDKGIPFRKNKISVKDDFVGAINQVKMKKCKTPIKSRTGFPELPKINEE